MIIRIVFALLCITVTQFSLAAPSYTGTWRKGVEAESGSGGVILIKNFKNQVKFQLELWLGPPSYNSGFIEGSFELTDGKGTFQNKTSLEKSSCVLEFVFLEDTLIINNIDGKNICDFGQAVYASGTYKHESRAEPKLWDNDPRCGPCTE